MSTTAGNPYLEGDFAPVAQELTVTEVPTSGTIPGFLDGRYLRNGPNPIATPNPATYHWFLGTGMVHGLRIRDGQVEWYRNRYVRSRRVAQALGEAVRPGPVHAGFDFAANTHVIGHAGRSLALVEGGPLPYELDDELATVGPYDFAGTLRGGYTAHPLRDPATGDLHAVSYYFGWGNRVEYSVIDPAGRLRRSVDIEVGGSPMMHSFSLTEHHVVIFDLPVTFDAHKAAALAPRPFARATEWVMARTVGRRRIPDWIGALSVGQAPEAVLPYSWNTGYPARVGVMPRTGGGADVRWFDVEPCFVYHPLNAYDDGDRIVVDVARHPKMFATEHRGPSEGPPTLDRWTVDLAAGKVLEERLDDHGQEFPRMDERLIGRRHRFGYCVGFEQGDGGVTGVAQNLIKHDLASGRTETRSFGVGHATDEFVFVPAGPDAAEDDGVLMGFVYDRESDRSDFMVLDAATLETIATAHLPARVPHGFHGSWVPA
ncbi:MAG TPA: carotenoid oxygenase family protein [Acidimicrobiales bacterium]|jgi:carotenoid cleavage dioxygenase